MLIWSAVRISLAPGLHFFAGVLHPHKNTKAWGRGYVRICCRYKTVKVGAGISKQRGNSEKLLGIHLFFLWNKTSACANWWACTDNYKQQNYILLTQLLSGARTRINKLNCTHFLHAWRCFTEICFHLNKYILSCRKTKKAWKAYTQQDMQDAVQR